MAVTKSMSVFQSVSVFCRCRLRWDRFLVNEKLLFCKRLIYFQLRFTFTERLVRFRNQGFVFGKEDELFGVFRSQTGSMVGCNVTPGAKVENRHRRKTDTDPVSATDSECLHSSTRLKKKSRLLSVDWTTAQAKGKVWENPEESQAWDRGRTC